ncbi:MAG: class I SAM-dependent methyltransferase [Deltaproteobacteria bacterium]|nr:class I SAM-dependent methyltransferase [Deltaproteobacteria bacterium]
MTLIRLITLSLTQQFGKQELKRTPEPSPITTGIQAVKGYDQALRTKTSLLYIAIIEQIRRLYDRAAAKTAIELCCGPGFLSVFLAEFLGYTEVLGVDLSPTMISAAQANARAAGLTDKITFQEGDVTKLHSIPSHSFDTALFSEAAHHLHDLQMVASVIAEMDRITKPQGLVLISDIARLRTKTLADAYVAYTSNEFLKWGLNAHLEDFKNTIMAVWTPKELVTTIPRKSKRRWVAYTCRCLPFYQIIIGVPEERKEPIFRPIQPDSQNRLLKYLCDIWRRENGEAWTQNTLREWKWFKLLLLQFPKEVPIPKE